MNRLFRVLIWFLLIVAVFVALTVALPNQLFVERNVTIKASSKTVFNQVNDLHSWSQWSKWNKMDPAMKIEYVNNGVGPFSGYTWESENKKVGSGSIMILESAKYDSIVINLSFSEQGEARSVFNFEETTEGTLVKWSLYYDIESHPLFKWMSFLMKKSIGNDFEEGLNNLNTLCKLLEEKEIYIIEKETLNAFSYASIREKVLLNEISLAMGKLYGNINTYLASTKAQMAGMPFTIYHLFAEEEIDMECGIPIDFLVEGNTEITTKAYLATECAILDFYGDYQNLEAGHKAVQEWIEKREFTLAGPPLEIYLTDPGMETDPDKWLTKICYPIE